ncbi:MAG: cytochrome c oxidase cbb3-type subunit 4 [Candidatus Azotimanducaceae bacterium]|jgi:cytochrome c oxidase cbb3-type subunit 4
MEIEDLRGIATILCMLAFGAIVYWAYAPSRKGYFETAAMLPFQESDETEGKDIVVSKVDGDSDE